MHTLLLANLHRLDLIKEILEYLEIIVLLVVEERADRDGS